MGIHQQLCKIISNLPKFKRTSSNRQYIHTDNLFKTYHKILLSILPQDIPSLNTILTDIQIRFSDKQSSMLYFAYLERYPLEEIALIIGEFLESNKGEESFKKSLEIINTFPPDIGTQVFDAFLITRHKYYISKISENSEWNHILCDFIFRYVKSYEVQYPTTQLELTDEKKDFLVIDDTLESCLYLLLAKSKNISDIKNIMNYLYTNTAINDDNFCMYLTNIVTTNPHLFYIFKKELTILAKNIPIKNKDCSLKDIIFITFSLQAINPVLFLTWLDKKWLKEFRNHPDQNIRNAANALFHNLDEKSFIKNLN
ncbi:MAG: hypothetical protein KKA19_09465 [Candidatus Margulisbacteria bacterium]|nr:hypothetical protein [Candidatus Margulisiibacteriota bacterium]